MTETSAEMSVVNGDVKCTWCAYALRGHTGDEKCPECGTPILFSVAQGPPLVRKPDQPIAIEAPTACVRCGAALQSLTSDDDCPNCHAPAWFSSHGNWLRASDPQWLDRLRRGVRLWLWALFTILFLNVVAFCTVVLFPWLASWRAIGWETQELIDTARRQFGLVASFFLVAAVFLSTTAEPVLTLSEPRVSLRRVLRVLAGALLACCVLARVVELAAVSVDAAFTWPFVVLHYVVEVLGAAVTLALIGHFTRLARRIPDRRLTRRLAVVFWCYCACYGADWLLTLSISLAYAYPGAQGPAGRAFPGGLPALVLTYFAVNLGFLVLTVWMVFLLLRYRRALVKARRLVCAETEGWQPAQSGPEQSAG
ncbi:MAG: hypothetical protein ACE5I3_04585 [Phycisphaerae bacterium]